MQRRVPVLVEADTSVWRIASASQQEQGSAVLFVSRNCSNCVCLVISQVVLMISRDFTMGMRESDPSEKNLQLRLMVEVGARPA
jgi:hypothetical protein